MAEEKDFFGEIGDFFGGIFDTAENALTRLISLEELRRTQELLAGQSNVPTAFQQVAPQPPGFGATGTATGTATGVGPFAGVPVEVMVMIVGAALVALVLLRR